MLIITDKSVVISVFYYLQVIYLKIKIDKKWQKNIDNKTNYSYNKFNT